MVGKAGKMEKTEEIVDKTSKVNKYSNSEIPFTQQETREWRQIEIEEESVQDVVRQYQAKRSAFWERWRRRTGCPVSRVKEVMPKKVILFAPEEVPGLKARIQQQIVQQQMTQRMSQG